jgi:cytochrome c5
MKRLLIALALLALIVTPLAVMAQDTEPEMETFTSEDETLTVSYPAEWQAKEGVDLPFPNVIFASSEETMTRLDADEDPISGDQVFFVMIIPTDLLTMVGQELPAEPTILDLTNAFAAFWSGAGEEEMEEAAATEEPTDEDMEATPEAEIQVGEAEEIQVGDDLVVGLATVTNDVSDGAVLVRDLGDGLLGIVYSATFPGEYEDAQTELAQQILASMAYTGTAEDILSAMMGTSEPMEGTEEAGNTGALDGDALVSERCTVCHTRDRIDEADKDEEGWTATVDRMISYGAQLSDEERAAVIQYLVETH